MKKYIGIVIVLVLLFSVISSVSADGESWTCPKCNERRTTEYCSVCGKQRPVAKDWYCSTCGKKLTAKDNFCPDDGTAKASGNANVEEKITITPKPSRNLNDLPRLSIVNTVKMSGGGSNVEVYTGPGSHYYRSASGKAAVHGAANVSAYGRIGDWVLIRYDAVISSSNKDVTRFAYAPVNKVMGGYNVPEVKFESIPITISMGVDLVDEPALTHHYNSFSAIQYNNAVALAQITEAGHTWVYFESSATSSQGTKPFRGFVQIQYVQMK